MAQQSRSTADAGEARTGANPHRFGAVGGKGGEILNVREAVAARRSRAAAFIETIGDQLARPAFFVTLLLAHLGWIIVNLGVMPGYQPVDPYPFVFLASVASVEAPFLSLLILMRQHRDARIGELREEISLQVALYTEGEVTIALRMLSQIHEKLGLAPPIESEVLEQMKVGLDPDRLMDHLQQHLDQSEKQTPPTRAPD